MRALTAYLLVDQTGFGLAGPQREEKPPMADRHETEHRSFRMDDGTGPGDITSLPSGHDACVVGDEPVVVVDWYGASK
jgi:hypothetical protein